MLTEWGKKGREQEGKKEREEMERFGIFAKQKRKKERTGEKEQVRWSTKRKGVERGRKQEEGERRGGGGQEEGGNSTRRMW